MDKKGAFELASQTVLWIPKILLFIFAVFIILAPIGCYINRDVEDGRAESYIVMRKAVSCLKKEGFDEVKLNDCMEQERYGIKIFSEDKDIVFNKDKYLDKVFCDQDKRFFCRKQTEKLDNKEFLIEVVVKSG